jgi:hypothetical protein
MNAKFYTVIVVEIMSDIQNKRQESSPSLQSIQMSLFILLPALKQLKIF